VIYLRLDGYLNKLHKSPSTCTIIYLPSIFYRVIYSSSSLRGRYAQGSPRFKLVTQLAPIVEESFRFRARSSLASHSTRFLLPIVSRSGGQETVLSSRNSPGSAYRGVVCDFRGTGQFKARRFGISR